MKNPQIEKGYTRIANEILEKLATYRISGEEWMVLLTILRKTYGFNKKEDIISISQFYSATGLAKSSICRSINKLTEKNIIYKKAIGITYLYCFNKLFNTWKVFTKKRGGRFIVNSVYKKVNKLYAKKRPQNTKDNIQKTLYTKISSLENPQVQKEIRDHYKITQQDLQKNLENLTNYCQSTGRTYKNYRAALNTFISRDIDSGKTIPLSAEELMQEEVMNRPLPPAALEFIKRGY